MARLFEGEQTFLSPVLRPVEKLFYRLFGVNEQEDMRWTTYAFAMLMFQRRGRFVNVCSAATSGSSAVQSAAFQRLADDTDLSFNTAMSFITNTNWQNYSPEVTISYFSKHGALAIHNWMSAATGIAIAIALIRGFSRNRQTA